MKENKRPSDQNLVNEAMVQLKKQVLIRKHPSRRVNYMKNSRENKLKQSKSMAPLAHPDASNIEDMELREGDRHYPIS